MAVVVAQSAKSTTKAVSLSGVGANSILVVLFGTNAGAEVSAVVDTASTHYSWSQVEYMNSMGSRTTEMWVGTGGSGGSVTVTLTATVGAGCFLVLVELSGAASVDVAGQHYVASVNPSAGPSLTPAGAGEMFLAFCNSTVDTQSPPAGWTHLQDDGGVYYSAYSLAGTSGVPAAPSWATTAGMIVAAVFRASTFHPVDAHGKLPSLEVSIDFTNDPTGSTRTWTDVTTDVRQLSYTRGGRSDALQQTSQGSLSMVLDNLLGNYDPSNTAGVYYPGVKRMRWMRVRAQWAGVTYNRWQGLIGSWAVSWPGPGKDSIVSVTATDSLKVLSLLNLVDAVYAPERTDERFTAVLITAQLPWTATVGQSRVVLGTISTSGLSHIQDVENTENGRIFADAGGTIVFQDRSYRLTHSATSQGTIGDASGEIPYRDTSYTSDDANIWNEALVTPSGGTAETASDATSEGHYFTRTLSRSLLTSDQAEALDAAQYLVATYKDPAPKLPALTLLPARSTSAWPIVLGAANSQRFTFRRRPSYGGTINADGFVEQVADTVTPGAGWDVTLQLAPAVDQSFWMLGDASFGLLGKTTVLIY